MLSRRRQQRGYTFIAVLIVLVILFMLSGEYFSTDTPSGKPWAMTTTDRARSAVALANTRSAETAWMMKTEGRKLPIQQMRSELATISQSMGSGGRFFSPDGYSLENTATLQTARFSDQFPLPRNR